MYLLRALNEFDINCDPINNGLASKILIYKIVENYYNTDKQYKNLNKKDKDLFIKEHINEYLINHQNKLEQKFDKYNREIRNCIQSILLKDSKYDRSYMKLVYALSTLNNHLINGSKTYTDWISLTANFECIFPYYDNQPYHYVAVVESSTNGIRDIGMNTLAIDVSSKDIINDQKVLCKKIDKEMFDNYFELGDRTKLVSDLVNLTKKDFMGYSFSQNSKEISYYQYIPSNKVVSVLEQIQIDLIRAEIFNFSFLKLDKKEQIEILNKFKYFLKRYVLMNKDDFMIKVLEELYLNNKNIKNSNFSVLEFDKVEHYRSKIMGIAKKIPNTLIK